MSLFHNRRCSPTWEIENGKFQSFHLEFLHQNTTFDLVVDKLQQLHLPPNVSLYLRGGIVEEYFPHPKADIDLLLVGGCSPIVVQNIQKVLMSFHRPIELLHVSIEQLLNVVPLHFLQKYRSVLIQGTPLETPSIPFNLPLIETLWHLYHPILCVQMLEGPVQYRLHSVKYLLRSVGVMGLFEGRYTRDLRTCIQWSQEYVPNSSLILQECFDGLSFEQIPPLNLRMVIFELIETFAQLKKNFVTEYETPIDNG